MADIFLSYSRGDAGVAQQVALALEMIGWDVSWDAQLVPGVDYRRQIAELLDGARCVVVLWSKASIKSPFVTDEAERARERGILIQVLIEDVQAPLGFRGDQQVQLLGWRGDPDAPSFRSLRRGIARHTPPRQGVRWQRGAAPAPLPEEIGLGQPPSLAPPTVGMPPSAPPPAMARRSGGSSVVWLAFLVLAAAIAAFWWFGG